MTFICPIPHCGQRRLCDHLMCREHWFSLPTRTRKEILASYRKARRCGSKEDVQRHRALCFEAIRSVAAKEVEPKDEYHQAELTYTTGPCKDER